jgi:hypothetical protein
MIGTSFMASPSGLATVAAVVLTCELAMPRVISACERETAFPLNLAYLCPEPVLVKIIVSCTKVYKNESKRRFFAPSRASGLKSAGGRERTCRVRCQGAILRRPS